VRKVLTILLPLLLLLTACGGPTTDFFEGNGSGKSAGAAESDDSIHVSG
jgi:peptidylprolyl isomerase